MVMKGRQGFSLIEVVIVLAIIAISLGIAGPRIGAGFGRLELFKAEGTIKDLIKFGRLEAQRRDRPHYLLLDQQGHFAVLLSSEMVVLRQEPLPSSVSFVTRDDVSVRSVYIAPSGILRGDSIMLRGRSGEVEVSLR